MGPCIHQEHSAYELLNIIHIDCGSTENLNDSSNEIPCDLNIDPLHIRFWWEIPENINPLAELSMDTLHVSDDPININIEEVDVDKLPQKSDILELHSDYMQAYIHIYSC